MQLTKSHLKDISAIAYSFHKSTGLDYDDLYQQAAIGYIKADKHYDNSFRASFITFAHCCAVNSVIDFLRQERKFKYFSFDELYWQVSNSLQITKYFGDLMHSLSETARNKLKNSKEIETFEKENSYNL
jgi:RNA polymerase sigma factor (sigma-70 family)